MPEVPDRPAEATGTLEQPEFPERSGQDLVTAGRLDPLMDALERQLRRNEVDESLLAELGWSVPQAGQFIESYKRARAAGQRQVPRTALPARTEATGPHATRERNVLRAEAPASPSVRALNATHQRAPDDTRELLQVGRQRVTPKYRPVLEAYYRSLATQPSKN